LIADIIRYYLTTITGGGVAVGGGAGAGAGPDAPAAPGETVIPPADTPLAAGNDANIGDNSTPLSSGDGSDSGAVGSLPLWAWIIIAAVIVIAVALIVNGVRRKKLALEEDDE